MQTSYVPSFVISTLNKYTFFSGSIIPGIILCLILFTSCHYLANVALLSGFVILTAITSSGGQAALMNMSPNFSGKFFLWFLICQNFC